MLKKLICVIFAACIVYTAVPAHAVSKSQFESRIKTYIQNDVSKAVYRECAYYNAQPPKKIIPHFSQDKSVWGVVLNFYGGCDPRVVSIAADMIAVEIYNTLKRLGMSDKQMQQENLFISVLPVHANKLKLFK